MGEPVLDCSKHGWAWIPYPNKQGVVVCQRLIDVAPGQGSFARYTMWSTTAFQLLLPIWTAHTILRLYKRYRAGTAKRFFSNPLVFAQTASILGSVLMAISHIDMWGLLGDYSPVQFLSIYAPGYGLIPCHTILMYIYIMDVVVIKRLSFTQKDKLHIGSIIAMGLIAVYAGVGYPIFGWILAYKFKKDPNTPLGLTGNYLAYAMYALILLLSLIVGISSSIALYLATKRVQPSKKVGETALQSRITRWWMVNFAMAVWYLAISCHRQFHNINPDGILDTITLFAHNRLIEVVLQWNTNNQLDEEYAEPWFLWHFIAFSTCQKAEIESKYSKAVSGSSGSTRLRSTSATKTTTTVSTVDSGV
jgi:hypothetical protein